MSTLTETPRRLGDLLMREGEQIYTRENCKLKNVLAAFTSKQVFGQPVKNITRIDKDHFTAELVAAADIANATGLVLVEEEVSLAIGSTTPTLTTKKYAVLARNDGNVINFDKLPTTDVYGASINAANFESRLRALGYAVRYEPTSVETAAD